LSKVTGVGVAGDQNVVRYKEVHDTPPHKQSLRWNFEISTITDVESWSFHWLQKGN